MHSNHCYSAKYLFLHYLLGKGKSFVFFVLTVFLVKFQKEVMIFIKLLKNKLNIELSNKKQKFEPAWLILMCRTWVKMYKTWHQVNKMKVSYEWVKPICFVEGGGRVAIQPHPLWHPAHPGRHDVHRQYPQPLRHQHRQVDACLKITLTLSPLLVVCSLFSLCLLLFVELISLLF